MTLVTSKGAADAIGVSRQAVDQAMARSTDPPQPRERVGQFRLYDLDEMLAWWKRRSETAVKEKRMAAANQPTAQCNIRITSDDYAFMKSIAEPGQTISHVGRMLLSEAIEARKAIEARAA